MKNMTNMKAFWICFFAPWLTGILAGITQRFFEKYSTSSVTIYIFSFIPFLIWVIWALSFFVLPFILGRNGTEFRKYGFYGVLASLFVFIFSIVPLTRLVKTLF